MYFGGTAVVLAVLLSVVSQVHSQGNSLLEVTDEVTFEVSHGGKPVGTIVLGLFGKTVPRTVNNFKSIAAGFDGKSYTSTPFHRIISGFMIQGGDVISQNGRGSFSIYGQKFEDENFDIKHYGKGWLSMANSGKNTNGSQFFITLAKTAWLDNLHVVFGKVVSGMEVVEDLGKVTTDSGNKPLEPVLITASSAAPVGKPYFVQPEEAKPGVSERP